MAWLGRHGSAVIALGVFLGLALPPLAALLKPLLIPAIVGPFLIALIRLDWQRLRHHLARPTTILLALLWLLVLSPLLVDAVVRPLGLPPAIHGGLVLMAAAPPLMASGALALMLGLDAALAVLVTDVSHRADAVHPAADRARPAGGADRGRARRADAAPGPGRRRLLRGRDRACAGSCRRASPCATPSPSTAWPCSACCCSRPRSWTGSTAMALARPRFVLLCALAVFGLNLGLQVLGSALFAWRGRRPALTLGLCSGNANLGLLLAALADRAALELFVFVAVAQLPIYTLPLVQRPLYRRWLAGERAAVGGPTG